MQIRIRGQRTEFLRAKYNPETQSSPAKLIGSQERYKDYLEPDMAEKLEPEEIEQAETYFAKKREESKAVMRRMAARDVTSHITEAASAIAEGQEVNHDQAVKIYQAMDELAKQLKRIGYPKSVVLPKKKKKAEQATDGRQTDAFSESG